MKRRDNALSDEPPEPKIESRAAGSQAAAARRPAGPIIAVIPALVVLITFLFWYLTWFGRRLSDHEMDQYLADTSAPHQTQHALSQLADRIARGDTSARRWYPLVLKQAGNKEAGLRLMAAWAMGQDNTSPEFHQALRALAGDPEAAVRWNAALALARFGDPAGEPVLRLMLRPYTVVAPRSGTVSFRVKEQDAVDAGNALARIATGDGAPAVEVRSPLAGKVERRLATDGAKIAAGEAMVLLSPGEQQIWESLRGLFLVGQAADLEEVERFARGIPGMSEGIRHQAALTAQAIRQRTAASGQ